MIEQIQDKHVYEGESIQAAVDNALPGDRIVIHEGTYREPIRIDKRDLELCGADGETVVLKGSRSLSGLEQMGQGVCRWNIPADWDGAVGWFYANETRLREVRRQAELEAGTFMLSKWELAAQDEIRKVLASVDADEKQAESSWRKLTTDHDGIVDLAPLTAEAGANCSLYLHVWVYSPRQIDGSLQLGSCDHDENGQWPMSLVNDFHGFRRPDGEYRTADQPATIWVNGELLEQWCQHKPAVSGFQWDEGWNSVLVQLKTSQSKRQRWFLRVCTHSWANTAIEGVSVGLDKDRDKCQETETNGKGIIVAEFMGLGPFEDSRGDGVVIKFADAAKPGNEDVVEVSTSSQIIEGVGDDCSGITLRGLTFAQAATNPKNGMVFTGIGAKGWTIEDCVFTESTGSGIDILSSRAERSTGHRIRRCRFIDNGCLGVQGWGPIFMGPRDILIEECYFEGSNWLDYSLTWHASSIKFCRISNSVFRNNVFRNNDCYGIWLDWECEGNLIEDNIVESCKSAGIFIEASRWGNQVVRNRVTNTRMAVFGGCGIYMHDSSDTYIMDNILINNDGFGYRIGLATNRKLALGVTMRRDCNVFMNNLLSHNGAGSLSVPKENIDSPENFYDGNIYWGMDAPPVFELAGCQGDDDVFDAENGVEPVIRKSSVVGLDALRQVMGQEENSQCREWSEEEPVRILSESK